MSFTTTKKHESWFTEQKSFVNAASLDEINSIRDGFDNKLETVVKDISTSFKGVNVLTQPTKLTKEIITEYKTELLGPIISDFLNYPTTDSGEKYHLEQVAKQLEEAWDQKAESFIQESFNTSQYMPLSTLDFPALVKQFIAFLGKDIIPIQTANSTNIEQRIITKYLVNNQTGEEYETPAIYYKKDTDGTPLWKKIFNAGKGYRINDKAPIMLADIYAANEKRYSLFNHLLDDAGQPLVLTPNPRNRLSYDISIDYVQVKQADNTLVKVKLPRNGIQIDLSTGGNFIGGDIRSTDSLQVIDPVTGAATGAKISISDKLSGTVDFLKGTIMASSCGPIVGIYCSGYMSNESNMRTIGFREYPEIRRFLIGDGVRFFYPFTAEDISEASANFSFNLYNRIVQEIVTSNEMFEDEYIVDTLLTDFKKYDGQNSDAFKLESYVHTEMVDLDPTSRVNAFAGDPYKYMTSAIDNGIRSVIYELCDKGKLDGMAFVIFCNPKAARLLKEFANWTVQKSSTMGGVKMNHAFGIMTDTDIPIRVVSSSRIDAYVEIPAYQDGASEGDKSRELFYQIVAYPMDPFHITYKHLRFARHIINSPENGAYQDAMNPGGAAMNVMTTSQYKTISIQGIQGRVILKNSTLAPDSAAGLIS